MTLAEHHAALLAYLKSRVELGDWHGVSDAANDLREMEAASPELKELAKITSVTLPLPYDLEEFWTDRDGINNARQKT